MPKNNHNTYIGKETAVRGFNLAPKSIDVNKRTVEAAILTDNPVKMYDWERGWINEILPMSTMRRVERMPLLDSHQSYGIGNILGTCTNLRAENGELLSTLQFGSDTDGIKAFRKVEDGHLTDLSGGYQVYKARYLEEGEEFEIDGRTIEGPAKIAMDWQPFEGSLCPIGADEASKIRSKQSNNNGTNSTQGSAGQNKQEEIKVPKENKRTNTTETPAPETSISTEEIQKAEKRAREEGAKLERERVTEIRSLCNIPGCEDMAEKLIEDGKSIEEARSAILDKLKETRTAVPATRVDIVHDERDKFRAAATDAVALRARISIEKPAVGAREIQHMSLVRLAEECLVRSGDMTRYNSSDEIIKRAMTTSDFPGILANTANKIMQNAYTSAPETYRAWCEIGEGRDFKNMSRPQLSEAPDLTLVNENGEYNEAAFKEIAPSFAIKTYGAVCSLTRQMIINDDLKAFLRIPRMFAVAAQRKIGDLVYAIITGNANYATLGDGTTHALFSAAHSNLVTPGAALSSTAIGKLRKALRVQKGINGSALGLAMKYLLVPAALEQSAEIICFSPNYPETGKNAGAINPVQRAGVTPIAEARLDASSETAYYGIADQNQVGTIEVAFLNGVETPQIVEFDGNNPDVKKFLVRIDAGVGLHDHRGLVKNAGA